MSEPKKFEAALDSDSRQVAGARGVRHAADIASCQSERRRAGDDLAGNACSGRR